MVNVQNENIFAWQKFQIIFGVLDIPDIFWRQTVDAGPNPTYKGKVRVLPPLSLSLTHTRTHARTHIHTHTYTHTHTHTHTVYDEKLLAR